MKLIITFLLLMFTTTAAAKDFNYETTYWFNKINLKCKSGLCELFINQKYKGQVGYIMDGDVAIANYKDYKIRLDLRTGDFKFK